MTKSLITATRYHDFSAGHRVVGHESKCAYLHGHNYRVHFECTGALDSVGRVLDFSAIKSLLCTWLELNWDHKFLAWQEDRAMQLIHTLLYEQAGANLYGDKVRDSIVWLPFNPTAENMAEYLLNIIGPQQLQGTGVRLIKVNVEETRKCAAAAWGEVE